MSPPDAPIPYARIAGRARRGSSSPDPGLLGPMLEDAWCSAYSRACRHEPRIIRFTDHGFTFLFDLIPPSTPVSGPESDDRIVAVYGLSVSPTAARDASRMKGFLGGGICIAGKGRFDKGHFMAHSMGGGLDANLFPQRAPLNRGWSTPGKRFRVMETYLAEHPGTFAFARSLYGDGSWVPEYLEYGLLRADGTLWVERFRN